MLVDSHVHLDSFPDDEVSQILSRGRNAGVGFVISAGTTLESSRRSIALSELFQDLFSGIGIHPMDIRKPIDDVTYNHLRHLATSTEKVLVISEIGLDFISGAPERPIQYQAFREQIRLARELRLPIVFHSREAHDEVLRILREERAYEVGGIMHYFQADERTAKMAIDLGFYLSMARPLLRLEQLQKVAATLPLHNLVLETDTAPQPFKSKREKWTEPRHVQAIAEKLSQLQRRSIDEIENATTNNIKALLNDKWHIVTRSIENG